VNLSVGRPRTWRLGLALAGFVTASCLLFWWLEHDQGLVRTPLDVVYWWVTTSTTVGYGDITPRTQGGRLLVILVVLAGVSVVATVAARAGSALLQRRLLQWRGLGRMDHLRGHTLVCGWSDDLEGILLSLVAHGQARRTADIALVSTRDADRLATLRTRPELQDLHIISGDSTRAADLERAGAARAAKALVLAEEGDPAPDSRTLLTVMAFRQLNKEAHLCAEVREQRFVRYVRDAGADELIDPGAFRRALAAQILVSPGMGNVFYHLLRLDKGASFGLEDVPADLEGRTFADLERRYLEREGVMLVGLVENVGNPLQVKRDALREAQRTPDVDQLVDRLREAKQVEPHHPVLCPAPGHVLRPRTQAVVVRRAEGVRP
jgi:voltage-gated potassium channel